MEQQEKRQQEELTGEENVAAEQQEHKDNGEGGQQQEPTRRMEQLERENAVLRQNAEAAARAPVRGVSSGVTASAPVSDFERGLMSDPW